MTSSVPSYTSEALSETLRCVTCDYDLRSLSQDHQCCPECGTTLAKSKQWRVPDAWYGAAVISSCLWALSALCLFVWSLLATRSWQYVVYPLKGFPQIYHWVWKWWPSYE